MLNQIKAIFFFSRKAAHHYHCSILYIFIKLLRLRLFHKFLIVEITMYNLLDPAVNINKNIVWSRRKLLNLFEILNPGKFNGQIDNKIAFAQQCYHLNLKCPCPIGFFSSRKGTNLFVNDKFEACDPNSFLASLPQKFVSKPQFGSSGHDVYLYSRDGDFIVNSQLGKLNYDDFFRHLEITYKSVPALFQEKIDNHSEILDLIDSPALMCVRIIVLGYQLREPEVIFSWFKIPGKYKEVDNFGDGDDGGIEVLLDLNSGNLSKGLTRHKSGFGLENVSTILSTHKIFIGFHIPFWNEAKDLAIKASKCFPDLRLIGWDIAITQDGPIIIEGNSRTGISGNFEEMNQFRDILIRATKEV